MVCLKTLSLATTNSKRCIGCKCRFICIWNLVEVSRAHGVEMTSVQRHYDGMCLLGDLAPRSTFTYETHIVYVCIINWCLYFCIKLCVLTLLMLIKTNRLFSIFLIALIGALHSPGTQRRNDVVLTSMRRDHIASTPIRRHFDVLRLLSRVLYYVKIKATTGHKIYKKMNKNN